MNPLPTILHFEFAIPTATSEQEFLRFVVQAAVKQYRQYHNHTLSPQITTGIETAAL
jgi:hypothetical protein